MIKEIHDEDILKIINGQMIKSKCGREFKIFYDGEKCVLSVKHQKPWFVECETVEDKENIKGVLNIFIRIGYELEWIKDNE